MADLTIKNDKGERLVGILEKPDLKGRGLILILHGFLTHKDSLWQKKLALSLPYPSYRFDSYGHGDSDGVYRYPNIVKGAENLRTVASYFDSQGWKIFGVVGYSGGAFAVHDFVLNWHYQIKHVVSICCRFEFASAKPADVSPIWHKQMSEKGYFLWGAVYKGEKRVAKITREQVNGSHSLYNTHCKNYPASTRVLIVQGTHDIIAPVDQGIQIHELIPNSDMLIIPKADHQLTGFHDVVVDEVMAFLPFPMPDTAVSEVTPGQVRATTPWERTRIFGIERWPAVQNVNNFRDLGGYMLHNHLGYVRGGAIFRSATLKNITAANWRSLEAMQVHTIFDLDAVNENPQPSLAADANRRGVTYIAMPIYQKLDLERKDKIKRWRQYMQGAAGFVNVYMEFLHTGAHAYGYILRYLLQPQVYSVLAKGKGSIVVSSKWGRDRVGLFSMILLGLCKVEDALIAKDYELSAQGMPGDPELSVLAKSMQCTLDDVRRASASPYMAMIKTLEVVRSTYGSMDGYVQQMCGLSGQDCDLIRSLMQKHVLKVKPPSMPKAPTAHL